MNRTCFPCSKTPLTSPFTGYDRDYPAYRKGLQKAGLKIEEVKYLFLTHHHDDHAGFLK